MAGYVIDPSTAPFNPVTIADPHFNPTAIGHGTAYFYCSNDYVSGQLASMDVFATWDGANYVSQAFFNGLAQGGYWGVGTQQTVP